MEHKYRLWDEKNGVMYQVITLPLEGSDGYGLVAPLDYTCEEQIESFYFFDDHIELLQSTGYLDKNNRGLYLGDIFRYKSVTEEGIAVLVNFFRRGNIHAEWIDQKTTNPSIYTSMDYLGCSSELEYLGNKYENPELLNEQV